VEFWVERRLGVTFKIEDDERAEISAEVDEAKRDSRFPENIVTNDHRVNDLRALLDDDLARRNSRRFKNNQLLLTYKLFKTRTPEGPGKENADILIVHQRFEEVLTGGKRNKVDERPWTLWPDARWRSCEGVEKVTPFYNMDQVRRLKVKVNPHWYPNKIFLHEGPNKANHITKMLEGTRTEEGTNKDVMDEVRERLREGETVKVEEEVSKMAEAWRASCPVSQELARGVHLAWAPGLVGWKQLRRANPGGPDPGHHLGHAEVREAGRGHWKAGLRDQERLLQEMDLPG
jgi:hypothetical protein